MAFGLVRRDLLGWSYPLFPRSLRPRVSLRSAVVAGRGWLCFVSLVSVTLSAWLAINQPGCFRPRDEPIVCGFVCSICAPLSGTALLAECFAV